MSDGNDRFSPAWRCLDCDTVMASDVAATHTRVGHRVEPASWDVLLTDGTQQFDHTSAVMQSIEDYRNATKGTASAT